MRAYSLALGALLFAWIGTAVAAPANFSGFWETTWNAGKQATRLNVMQAGNKITGGYTYQGGHIDGVVDGSVAFGRWWQADGARGEFRFVLSPDGESFKGNWKNASKPNWQGSWNGIRRQ